MVYHCNRGRVNQGPAVLDIHFIENKASGTVFCSYIYLFLSTTLHLYHWHAIPPHWWRMHLSSQCKIFPHGKLFRCSFMLTHSVSQKARVWSYRSALMHVEYFESNKCKIIIMAISVSVYLTNNILRFFIFIQFWWFFNWSAPNLKQIIKFKIGFKKN